MTGFRQVDLRGLRVDEMDLAPVVDHLNGGGLIVYPTETVYGIGCLLRPEPLAILRRFKSRGPGSPFLVLVPGPEDTRGLVWTAGAREMARVFWPGALTLVLADPGGRLPSAVRSMTGGVAVRQSSHPLAARLVERLGEPVVSTSANAHGEPPARTGEAAATAARRVGAGPETWILDVGHLAWSPPSTVVDCTRPVPSVVREGSVPVQRLRCVLPEIHGATND
jgi:tRNA threonylcarbamoyl adenosine modification protein (Sua5/YciO/YrdC/YwlC family)